MATSSFPIHKSISYEATRLQNLNVWLPRPLENSNPNDHVWMIYVHGGAWRDPTQDLSTVLPTLTHLPTSRIAGVASINYRLSPYPSHPSDPSDPSDDARNVKHPQHVQDVMRGIRHLLDKYDIGVMWKWIGVGHSCGATLLLQYVSGVWVHDEEELVPLKDELKGKAPSGLILLEGIYDLPLLLKNHKPPACSEQVAKIYEDIVKGAFGEDAEVYTQASPVNRDYTVDTVGEMLRYVVLGYSAEDELVEEEQWDSMYKAFLKNKWTEVQGQTGSEQRIVEKVELKGAHDWIWEDGKQIAALIEDTIKRI